MEISAKTEIKEAIIKYSDAKGFSQNDLAKTTGVSSATISKILNNNWDSIDERLWLKLRNKVEAINNPGLFSTTDFISTVNICSTARNNRLMIGLIADTGMGKTTALKHISCNKNTFYVAYDKTMKPKQFFIALLKEMGISQEGSLNEMVNLIADELNTMDAPLVIIDEAGKITHTMILYLHVLRDKTINNCGFVLAGMPYFKSNLLKLSNKQREGYAEFYRRVNLWHSLTGLNRSEIDYICTQYQITNTDKLKELRMLKRFGDLINAILLQQIILNN